MRTIGMRLGLWEKHAAELAYWHEQIQMYVRWYQGRSHLGIPPPTPEQQITGYDLAENAIRTWAVLTQDKYPRKLYLPTDYFTGLKVLDVGCGPVPYALGFTGCEVWGLDQLTDDYREAGFPLDRYDPRMHYVTSPAEQMPLPDAEFDAVICVNAFDHLDDVRPAAAEIVRVLKPGGILRLESHYHKPTTTEIWQLSDDLMREVFAALPLQKLHETPRPGKPRQKYVVWGCGDRQAPA